MGFYFGCTDYDSNDEDDDEDLTFKLHRLDVTKAFLCATPVIDQMLPESEKRKAPVFHEIKGRQLIKY